MHMVRHGISFYKSDLLLAAQLTQYRSYLLSPPPEEHFSPAFWYTYNVLLAAPLYMSLTLPILHSGSPWSRKPSGNFCPLPFSTNTLFDFRARVLLKCCSTLRIIMLRGSTYILGSAKAAQ
jgi:hypothetical protein